MPEIKNIKITSQMLMQITEIDGFKRMWTGFASLKPEQLKVLRKVSSIESLYSSNRIEGNKRYYTAGQSPAPATSNLRFVVASAAELRGIKPFVSSLARSCPRKRGRDLAPFVNKLTDAEAELMNAVFDNYSIIPLTGNYVKQLHRDLLKFSSKDERHLGEYKKLSRNQRAVLKLFDYDKTEWSSSEIAAQSGFNIEIAKKVLNL